MAVLALGLAVGAVWGPGAWIQSTWAQGGSREAADNSLFARQTRWSVEESWHKDKLVYTLEADGTFRSSSASGKGVGRYMRDRNAFVMVWPLYDHAVYVGTIGDGEIRGSGYSKDGKPFGTFVLRLMR